MRQVGHHATMDAARPDHRKHRAAIKLMARFLRVFPFEKRAHGKFFEVASHDVRAINVQTPSIQNVATREAIAHRETCGLSG